MFSSMDQKSGMAGEENDKNPICGRKMCDCAAGEFPYIMFISKVFKGKYDRDYGVNEPIFGFTTLRIG